MSDAAVWMRVPRRRSLALPAADVRWRLVAALMPLFLLFGQVFHYVKAIPPLWALSKAFPILTLPLALLLFAGTRPPAMRQVLITFTWLVLVPSFIAIWTFQQSFFAGLAAQVKLLPILYFFSVLALLRRVRPTLGEIGWAFLIAGLATFAVLIALGVLAPQSWYAEHYKAGDSPILSADSRGNRIRMPMYFALIATFWAYRRFLGEWRPRWLVLAGAGFACVMLLVRTRSMVLGVVGIAAINAWMAASKGMRVALVVLLPMLLGLLFTVPYVASVFRTDSASGFDVRWISTVKAIDFLGLDPLRWLFGVGTISPLDPDGLMTYFNHFFFLADITWIGVLFEYGLVGALMILAIPLRGLALMRDARRAADTPFLAALQDYLVYSLLISELLPMTLAPGELTVIMAIAVYAREARR